MIDRPKGSAHPRYPEFIYKVDYGYLKNTSSIDDAGRGIPITYDTSFNIDICYLSKTGINYT